MARLSDHRTMLMGQHAALRALHPEVYYQLKRAVAKKKAELPNSAGVLGALAEVIPDLIAALEAEIAAGGGRFRGVRYGTGIERRP